MSTLHNEYGQPIAAPVPDWHGAKAPEAVTLAGRFVRLEPVDVERHARDLFDAYATETDGSNWTYLAVGPFDSFDVWKAHFTKMVESRDPRHFAVIDLATGKAVGTLSLMRIDAPNGVIEVGHVTYSPLLQRSRASTETIYVLMKYVFDTLGNRRFEWKCNSLNAPSRAAAERYGFTYEGLFRQAIVTRGRNRDTTWYSILDSEWPATRVGFEQWLDDRNFDADGRQIARLTDLIAVQRAAASNRTAD